MLSVLERVSIYFFSLTESGSEITGMIFHYTYKTDNLFFGYQPAGISHMKIRYNTAGVYFTIAYVYHPA